MKKLFQSILSWNTCIKFSLYTYIQSVATVSCAYKLVNEQISSQTAIKIETYGKRDGDYSHNIEICQH